MVTEDAPPITARLKTIFGLGSTAEAIVITSSGFLLLYYNRVLGVPAGLVGTALSAGIVLNAVRSADRFLVRPYALAARTRHPFMFASNLPVALAFTRPTA